MGRRQRRRDREGPPRVATVDYPDAEGNVLTLRARVSDGTVAELLRLESRPGASAEDRWQRREEILFERLAVSWSIAGLPLTRPGELLGRYRMADAETRRWVRETVGEHARRQRPELGDRR